MSADEAEDWKTRLKSYEDIIKAMIEPTDELLQQVEESLPEYLEDENPNCQKAALTLCDTFLKNYTPEDISPIAEALIFSCFDARQQNSDVACQLVLQCLKRDKETVIDLLFDDVENQSTKHILNVLSVVISHLATLTQKDCDEVNDIIEMLEPLVVHSDKNVQREARAAVASAKIITGDTFESTDDGHEIVKEEEADWCSKLRSTAWKDRKEGYELLLDAISPEFQYQDQETKILNAIVNEKHVACIEIIVLVVEKLALTFKTQLQKRLRDYITPIINGMKEKRQSRFFNLTEAFDAVANNVSSSSPLDPPFVDYLMSMLTSGTIKLREEGLQFILRNEIKQLTPVVQEQLQKMTEDQAQTIRETVTKVLVKYGLQKQPEQQQKPKVAEPKKQVRRKQSQKQMFNFWESWVNPETLNDLRSNSWNQVTDGLEQLKKQYDSDKSCPQVIITGLSKTFHNRTFTPKVMVNLLTDMLYYTKEDPTKISDEAVLANLQFCLEKLPDKRLESQIFELIDNLCVCSSGQFVFGFFYNQLNVKSPVVLGKITSYFAQYLAKMDEKEEIDFEEFANNIQPLFTHGDQIVRKAAMDCYNAIVSKNNDQSILDHFKYVKPLLKKPTGDNEANESNQDSEQKKNSKEGESSGDNKENDSDNDQKSDAKSEQKSDAKKAKHKAKRSQIPPPGTIAGQQASVNADGQRQKVSVIPGFRRAISPKKSSRPYTAPGSSTSRSESPQRALIPPKLIQCIAKSSSTLDNRKGFEEISLIISKLLDANDPNTMPYSDFNQLFIAIEPWFKEYNQTIIQSVAKLIESSLKLIKVHDATLIPNDFLCNMLFLLNYNVKSIRNSCIGSMNTLNTMLPNNSYIKKVFLPMFAKLGAVGKLSAIKFLKDCDTELDVDNYSLFFVQCIANKSDEFKEAITPLLTQYLVLPGAVEALSKEAEQFPPAKKRTILQTISMLMKKEGITEVPKEEQSYFKQTPTKDELADRKHLVDQNLLIMILNGNEELESLNDVLLNFVETYFSFPVMDDMKEASKFFIDAANNDFENFSLVLDIVFMWWSNETIQRIMNGDNPSSLNIFIRDVLSLLALKKRTLSQFELMMIVPTLLDCTGRNGSKWELSQNAAFKLCNNEQLLSSLQVILANSTSDSLLEGTFKALKKLLVNKENSQKVFVELSEIMPKVLEKLSKSDEIYEVASEFAAYVQESNTEEESVQESNPEEELAEEIIENKSVCYLNDTVVSLSTDPSVCIYHWIADLMTEDEENETKAIKSIIAQLKTDESILKPHITVITEFLILKIHKYFAMSNPPTNVCNHILLCLSTIFGETKLPSLVQKELLQQLIYELITHLSNGQMDKKILEMINPVIVRIIEACTILSFMVLIAALGESNVINSYSDKWAYVAVMYFEMCATKIVESGSKAEILNASALIEQFFEKHQPPSSNSPQISAKAYNSVKNFGQLLQNKSSGQSADSPRKLTPLSSKIAKPSPMPPSQRPSRLKPLRL